jgi:hypothetical protein
VIDTCDAASGTDPVCPSYQDGILPLN